MTNEIVSVQVGTNANYVGAHFWNLQDEYLATPVQQRDLSPAALLSEIAPTNRAYASGLRYAPRLQIIDSSGAFGALSTQAGVVLPSSSGKPAPSAWKGSHLLIERDPIPHSSYIRHIHAEEAHANATPSAEPDDTTNPPLDDIKYWTDYLKVRLHPRTGFQLPGVHHHVSNLQHFLTGEELAKPLLEDLYDNLRHFVEDCDCFGGLNVITNADDAFSGMTAAYLDHVVEELGSSLPVIVFGTHSLNRTYTKQDALMLGDHYRPDVEHRLSANEAQLVTRCMDYSAEYIPLASPAVCRMPNLHVNKHDLFQTSAVLGLALDVSLVPVRQRLSLSGMLGSIRPMSFATLGSIGCNLPPSSTRVHFGRNLFGTKGTVNLSSLRHRCLSPASALNGNGAFPLRCFESVSARGVTGPLPICSNLPLPVTLPIPFPPVFDASLSPDHVDSKVESSHVQGGILLDQIAIMAGLGTIPETGQKTLIALSESLRKSALEKHQGLDETQLSELREALIGRADDYGKI